MQVRELMSTPAITVLGATPVSEALCLLDQHKIAVVESVRGVVAVHIT